MNIKAIDKEVARLFPNLPLDKKYQIILIDPPWYYDNPKVQPGIKPKYRCLTFEQLLKLPIQQLSDENCILLVWTTSPMMKQATQLIESYGFEYRTVFAYWEKYKNGNLVKLPGSYSQSCIEPLLIGVKGNIQKYKLSQQVHQLIRSETSGHSKKPYKQLHKMLKDKFNLKDMNCLEIFARERNMEEFDIYGNELQPNFQPKLTTLNKSLLNQQQQYFIKQESTSRIVAQDPEPPWYKITKGKPEVTKSKLEEHHERVLRILNEAKYPKEYKHFMKGLAQLFPNVFAFSKQEIGKTHILQHEIELNPGAKPIQQKPYRHSPLEMDYLKKEIQTLLDLDCIEECTTEWTSPVILVKKKDTKDLRMCIDFRKLNQVMVPEIYPIPRIDDILYQLRGNTLFTKLDLKSGFWQIVIREEDRKYTGFTCPLGTFRWKRMPFGLKNAPAAFQRAMNKALKPYLGKFAMVYIDDIIIYSKSPEEHAQHVKLILEALQQANLTISLEKCEFFQKSIKLLGHEVSGQEVRPLEDKVIAIRQIPVPINKKKLRSFLGLANYYRNFIQDFSKIAKPLYALLKESAAYIWTEQQNQAFDLLKESLCKDPVLTMPLDDKKFILYTDFSEEGLGAVLSQQIEEGKSPMVIEYASRSLRGAEMNYPAYEGEVLAVHWALEKFRYYLLGRKFQLVTDNKALQSILVSEKKSKKIIRWLLDIQEYAYEPIHRPGTQHMNADSLSRLQPTQTYLVNHIFQFEGVPDLPCEICKEVTYTKKNDMIICDCCGGGYHQNCHTPKVEVIPKGNWYCSRCLQAEHQDITMDFNLIYFLENGQAQGSWSKQEVERVQNLSKSYQRAGRHLYLYTPTYGYRIIPTISERRILIQEQHSLLGHPSVQKLEGILKQSYFWSNMTKMIEEVVKRCATCAARSIKQQQPQDYQPTDKGNYPFHTVSIDLAMAYPKSKRGNKNMAICVDNFSKWVEVKALPNKQSATIAEWFWEEIICRYGCPKYVRSDNGGEFKGKFLKLLQDCSITIINTSPSHPQGNGIAERMIGTIKRQLTAYVNDPIQDLDWDEALMSIAMSIRSAVARAIEASPYQVLFGRKMDIPTAVIYDVAWDQFIEPTTSQMKAIINKQQKNLDSLRQVVLQKLKTTDEKNKTRYESNQEPQDQYDFKDGQMVFLKRFTSQKLQMPSTGPFIFRGYCNKARKTAWVFNPKTLITTKQHISNLLPWVVISDTDDEEDEFE